MDAIEPLVDPKFLCRHYFMRKRRSVRMTKRQIEFLFSFYEPKHLALMRDDAERRNTERAIEKHGICVLVIKGVNRVYVSAVTDVTSAWYSETRKVLAAERRAPRGEVSASEART